MLRNSPLNRFWQCASHSSLASLLLELSILIIEETKEALSDIDFNIISDAILASKPDFNFEMSRAVDLVCGPNMLNIAAVEIPMIDTIAKAITMAKPSDFFRKKAEGITLAETLIYISIFGVVSAGIWQTFIFINQTINTNIRQTAELEESETYLNYISTLSAKAVSSQVSDDKTCIFFENEASNGDITQTRFKIVNDTNSGSGALTATGWVTTDSTASCDDTPAAPAWRALSEDGALSLVRSSKRSLNLGALFNSDTSLADDDYSFNTLTNLVEYNGRGNRVGLNDYVGLNGAASFTVDFWIQNPFSSDFTTASNLSNPDLTDNSTIIAIGHPTDANKQMVLGFLDKKLILRRGGASQRYETVLGFDHDNITGSTKAQLKNFWSHVAVSWDNGTQTAKFYVNGEEADAQNVGGAFNFNLPITSHLYLGGFDIWDSTTPVQRQQGNLDELRIWDMPLSQGQIKNVMRRESLPEEAALLNYWRFEQGHDTPSFNDNNTHIRDWAATNEQPLRYYSTSDNVTYNLGNFPGYLSTLSAPLAASPFKVSGSSDALSLELQFAVTNSFGAVKRQPTLSKRVPVARFAPVGLVALEDNSSVEIDVEIIGSHEDFNLEFDAIFDPSVVPQANACDLYNTDTPGGCNFSSSAIRVPLDSTCAVADNDSLARCTIQSNDITLTDGVAYSSIELRRDDTSNAKYQTVPGDKITMQIYETCTFDATDDGTTAMLIDTGYMQGGDFINRRSYVTYSFDAESGEDIEYLFGTSIGGSAPTINNADGNNDRVPGSPDFGAFTKRRHISPFLFRETDGTYNFVMGFDRPYKQWSSGTDLWNNSFSSRYDFTVASSDSSEACASIGVTEVAMCAAVQDPGPVQVCNNPNTNTYCYVEYQISAMPTDPAAFVKLDESNEFQIPTSSIDDLVGVNRWGNGATDGFVVDLGVTDLQNYGPLLADPDNGDPLMRVLSRAGMDYWFLMTTPNDADGGTTVKLRLGETDTVRYRLSTSKVCP